MLFYLIILVVTAVDQITKVWIRSILKVGESMPFYKDIISFTHYQNSGAAGSSLQGSARYLGILAVVIIAVILYYRKKGSFEGFFKECGAAFFVGGAIGNGIERLLFGKVTDFIVFRSGHGVMNLADLAINLGVVFFVLDLFLSYRHKLLPKEKKFQ
ncbi:MULTISPECIES: signal peptidase II [unclassified Paenibacillus]|uniref:signal peptidase II n=1 Tax=unclassified Paenibacillus TaxID=185978 RepID=UPI00070BAA21|nr:MULTISPECIES: signal peptidase II [unclassified Paenibacillus]KQX44694.1 signal peptidase II [Paenibacillus sp. Root444D2]KRE32999.1 signal peptidase II [Paenibacillus sp. Soil724D2]